MKRSRYAEVSGSSEPPKNYYGMTQAEWYAMTPQSRIIHYHRCMAGKCDHVYKYEGIEGNVNDERLLEQQSFDPYANTAHLLPHDVDLFRRGLCSCQTCDQKFGIPRGEEKRHVNPDKVREKLA